MIDLRSDTVTQPTPEMLDAMRAGAEAHAERLVAGARETGAAREPQRAASR